MNTTIDIATAGPIGLLIGAITTLWAWYVTTVNKKDKELAEARKENKELAQKVISVIEKNNEVTVENTKATIEQKAAFENSTKASEAVYHTLTEYVLKAASK